MSATGMWSELDAAVTGAPDPLTAADRLCRACVSLLGVDGASCPGPLVGPAFSADVVAVWAIAGAIDRSIIAEAASNSNLAMSVLSPIVPVCADSRFSFSGMAK